MAGPGLLIKKRLLVVLICFFVFTVSLIVRVAYIQVVQGEELQKKAFEQQNRGRVVSPKRGTIYDRNGKELAISASVETISVSPSTLKNSMENTGISAETIA